LSTNLKLYALNDKDKYRMTWVELRAKCKRQSDYIITLFITNEIALIITWMLIKTRVTPNQVTIASILCGLGCALCYTFGKFLPGSLLLFISHILDCTDGNLARAQDLYSPIGKWLDMFGDRFAEAIVFMGIGIYFFHTDASPAWLLLSLIDAILLLLYYYIVDLSLALGMSEPIQIIGKMKFKDVHVKWGIMEPVIYGFIILSSLGLIKIQMILIFILTITGLLYQGIKVSTREKKV